MKIGTVVALSFLAMAVSSPVDAAGRVAPPGPHGANVQAHDANVQAVDPDKATLRLKFETPTGPSVKTVDASAAKDLLGTIHPADEVRVTLVAQGADKPDKVAALSVESRYVDWSKRWLALAGALGILFGLALVVTGGRIGNLVVGTDNRYSKSQVQFALWSVMALGAYLATIMLRVWAGGLDLIHGVQITQNLLVLSGLSAVSFGAAKMITTSKTETPGAPRKTQGAPDLRNLFRDDYGNTDLGDFQMIVVTLIAATIYFWTVFHFLGSVALVANIDLPDVDSSLVAAFGLGQGAYLAKKAALPVGRG